MPTYFRSQQQSKFKTNEKISINVPIRGLHRFHRDGL